MTGRIYPITFSFPEEKIVSNVPKKTKLFSDIEDKNYWKSWMKK